MKIDVDIAVQAGAFALDVKFALEGRVVGIFGRSGCGKTTVVNAIAGVTTPQRGHVRVGDTTLFDSARGIDLPPQARRVGYVFQDSLLFPHLSVEANLLYGHRQRNADERFLDPARVIALLGLRDLLQRKPGRLSGGEKQRVAIGRALLAQPRLLLLDEPLASLDVPRRIEILDYIELLRDEFGIPIVLVSHSVPEITRLADSVVVLAQGTCLAAGDVEHVMGRLDLRPHTGRYEAGSVIEAVVTGTLPDDQLTTLAFAGGELLVPDMSALPGERVRVRIRARDVSLATERPAHVSLLNVLPARVVAVREEAGPVVDVQLAIGEAILLARITQRSRRELGIAEGREVFAMVKAVSFDRRSVGYA
ncbi:MAG: molybdenum ABC transporter ATP-binding protein [Burkholderiales bacterium]